MPESTRGNPVQRYIGPLIIVLLLGFVLTRVLLLKRNGIKAMKFGEMDKKDFLILPFVIFYFYLVFAAAFDLPAPSRQQFFHSRIVFRLGEFFSVAGLLLLFLSLVSFGKSFRVGIDQDRPDKLVTAGIFAFSRNPIYVAFAFVLLAEFLLFSNWILLAYMLAAVWLFQRQVRREEEFMRAHYGRQYLEYCRRVRRYL